MVKCDICVNHEYKFIFIHIPKNAGTSISTALELPDISHATVQQVKKVLTQQQFESYFKFCFVRNPWDRFLSLYNYARLEESHYHSSINPEQAIYGKHLDYDILKNATLEECANYLIQGKLKHDAAWNHWQPQITWIKDEQGKIPIDFIGKLEKIEEDFAQITRKIGIVKELPYMNKSKERSSYRKYYTEDTRQLINDYYIEDIEQFGYDF